MAEENKDLVVQQAQVVPVDDHGLIAANRTPEDVVADATRIANTLAPIIEQKKLFASISGRRHVMAEAWAALLGLLNVDPVPAWCRRLDRDGETVYEARMELFKNGRLIGGGEAIASSKESGTWARSEHGIKSMAQTRALGKAARIRYAWIMVLAGYEPTAVEEFAEERPKGRVVEAPVVHQVVKSEPAESEEDKMRKRFWAQLKKLIPDAEMQRKIIKSVRGQESTLGMSQVEADKILMMAEFVVADQQAAAIKEGRANADA